MFNLDLKQAENRIVAYVAPEPKMIHAFKSGVDLHKQTAALILNKSIEEVTDDERNKVGKPSNHGLNYGEGAEKLSLKYGIPLDYAKFMVEKYHSVYPGIRNGFQRYVQECLRGTTHTLENCAPYCRKRYFINQNFQKAYSHIPSSTVADKMWQDGIGPLYYDQETYGCLELLNQIHDSIKLQALKSAGLEKISAALLSLITSLEKPVSWRTTEFILPVELSWGPTGDEKNNVILESRTVPELITEIESAISSRHVPEILTDDNIEIEEDEEEE